MNEFTPITLILFVSLAAFGFWVGYRWGIWIGHRDKNFSLSNEIKIASNADDEILRLKNEVRSLQRQLTVSQRRLETASVEARTDAVSGLWNRKAFEEKLRSSLESYHELNLDFALLFVDVDQFKRINDRGGHLAGDHTLAQVADALLELTRDHDHVSRFGGDEFAILLEWIHPGDVDSVVKRILQGVSRLVEEFEGSPVTCSLGIALPVRNDTANSLVTRADTALYRSKRAGRNRATIAAIDSGGETSAGESRLAAMPGK